LNLTQHDDLENLGRGMCQKATTPKKFD